MALSYLARFLFGLALLAQVAASVSAPAASARICGVTHSDARAQTFADGTSEQAPQRETGHRHGPCSFCLFGSGDAPLHSTPLALETVRVADRLRRTFAYAEGLIFFQVDRNAAARAPPAFS
jgi:hypothetical protein